MESEALVPQLSQFGSFETLQEKLRYGSQCENQEFAICDFEFVSLPMEGGGG